MQCVILAAGRGTRMGDLTKDTPKPMLSLHGRPKLAYTIEALPDAIDEVILVVGYLQEKIRAYFGDNFANRRVHYVAQRDLSGTFGALATARHLLKEKFLVIMGDDLYAKQDLEKLLSYECAVLAFDSTEAEHYGLLHKDAHGHLVNIIERPHGKKHGLVNTGAYVITKEIFSHKKVLLPSGEAGLPQTLLALRKSMPIVVVETTLWQSVGTPEDLKKAEEKLTLFT